ncbi:uncharacterized protein ASCRUDRAFT_154552 [Ascoidea rubescens DSM 1968]|uniref:Uncharacterized protein n=1 Tax=Ascoidea rubescens DSM 1968 TaxID=1344418 RepID=A0A1D2VFP6_9ASCO|nr:hypothetical protein ASCRUDRAFT_154552 [Ascoidea rubescens DSM 1968]ODV60494.1 hypothetical protein ASCRUDRAFT_154552 [Ascoidea rubescens DSM 1968]
MNSYPLEASPYNSKDDPYNYPQQIENRAPERPNRFLQILNFVVFAALLFGSLCFIYYALLKEKLYLQIISFSIYCVLVALTFVLTSSSPRYFKFVIWEGIAASLVLVFVVGYKFYRIDNFVIKICIVIALLVIQLVFYIFFSCFRKHGRYKYLKITN